MGNTVLTLSDAPKDETVPHLMPFHIKYTGKAPISTYFMMKPTAGEPSVDDLAPAPTEDANIEPTRYIAAFRGRTVQGTLVPIPVGYAGLVLRSSTETRSQDGSGEEQEELKTLNIESTFSSLLVWNPDIPVDEAKDQYLRSLSEWTKLTAEVCLTHCRA